jgi:hypothetical protein
MSTAEIVAVLALIYTFLCLPWQVKLIWTGLVYALLQTGNFGLLSRFLIPNMKDFMNLIKEYIPEDSYGRYRWNLKTSDTSYSANGEDIIFDGWVYYAGEEYNELYLDYVAQTSEGVKA